MNTDTNNIKYLTEEELSKLDAKRLDQLVKKTRILDSKLDTESEDIQKDIDKLLLMKQIKLKQNPIILVHGTVAKMLPLTTTSNSKRRL